MAHALAHHYNLPMCGLGGWGESNPVDQQAAAEAARTLMGEALGGANLIHDLGYLESGLSGSLAQLVICDEIVGWLARGGKSLAGRGAEGVEETLAEREPEPLSEDVMRSTKAIMRRAEGRAGV